MKTFEEFKSEIIELIQEKLGDVKIDTRKVLKNNGRELTGITILESESNIAPTIYLDFYYLQYRQGRKINDIVDDIIEIYNENKFDTPIELSFFTDYDNVKNKIVYSLVNYERNKELLTDTPHIRYLDLAIVFRYVVQGNEVESATILIKDNHIKLWGISKEELYARASVNTPLMRPCEIVSMSNILKGLLQGDISDDEICMPSPMYVITNKQKCCGASCILYENVLKEFADRMESDLYILPSSIHEMIIISASYGMNKEELTEMVRSVNSEQVADEDILSDNVYIFERATGQMR